MTVLVCGSRKFNDQNLVNKVLNSLPVKITRLVNGASKGVDKLSSLWAKQNNIELKEYPANWSLGKKAGPLRNSKMISSEKIDLVIAFPGANGTANMILQSTKASIDVLIVEINDQNFKLIPLHPKTNSIGDKNDSKN